MNGRASAGRIGRSPAAAESGPEGRDGKRSLPEIARRLRQEGIACTGERPDDDRVRLFDATVYDLEATDVRRIVPGRGVYSGNFRQVEPDDRLRRIVARTAVRALYALGMACGQAQVAIDENGRAAIVRVSANMRPKAGESARRTREAMERHAAAMADESVHGVRATLGADPEFVLQSPDGKVVSAARYLPPGGLAGCDSVVRRGVRVWPLVELRPDPAREPAAVVASLRRLLLLASQQVGRARAAAGARAGVGLGARLGAGAGIGLGARSGASAGAGALLRWRAGACPVPGLPLGGHVHISGAALTGERLRALDNAVALPLRLLEPPGAASRRPRYGALGDFRRQPHGGFEYRTPPSWLVSPRLALGVLSLAKIAAEHAGDLAGCRPLDDQALRDAFYAEDRDGDGEDALREAALAFHAELTKLSGYRRYAAAVDPIFHAVRARRHWDETADLRRKWGIPIDG